MIITNQGKSALKNTSLNDNTIFFLKDLADEYCFTKIYCPFTITNTHDINPSHKKIHDIKDCDIHFTDVCIASTVCNSVAIKKSGQQYLVTIIVNKIIDDEECIRLVEAFATYSSFFLMKQEINAHHGVPRFVYDVMQIKAVFGTSPSKFTKQLFLNTGSVSTIMSSQFLRLDFFMPTSTVNILKYKLFVEAMAINDTTGKYIRLYRFFQLLHEYHIVKETGVTRDAAIYKKLNDLGIVNYKLWNGSIEEININTIENLRKTRNKVAHGTFKDSNVFNNLYHCLIPIVEQIVTCECVHFDESWL